MTEESEEQEELGSFFEIWRDLKSKDPERLLCRIASEKASRSVSFRVQTAYKRVARVAGVFRKELGLAPGSRVLLYAVPSDDIFLILHGLWFAGLSAVVVGEDFEVEELDLLARRTRTRSVIFPTASSARVSQLYLNTNAIEHWVLCGASTSVPSVPGIKKLEEMIAAIDESAEYGSDVSTGEGLIAVSRMSDRRIKAASFSQKAVVEAGFAAASLLPSLKEEQERETSLSWCALDASELEGLIQSVVAPLFSPLPVLLRTLVEPRKFWEQSVADGVRFAILSQDHLRIIARRGKSRTWRKPDELEILLYSKSRLSRNLIETFEERFKVPILPCYSVMECGGAVVGFEKAGEIIRNEHQAIAVSLEKDYELEEPEEEEEEDTPPVWEFEFSIPAAGRALKGCSVKVVDPNNMAVPPERAGRLKVRSPYGMSGYLKGYEGDAIYDAEGYLFPADEGFYMIDQFESVDLFVTGREKDFVVRRDKRVNLARIENVLKGLKGVQSAVVLGFPNRHSGTEIGAYVTPLPAAHLKDYELTALARRELNWHESPKVLILARKNSTIEFKTREKLLELFKPYKDMNYTRGEDAIEPELE